MNAPFHRRLIGRLLVLSCLVPIHTAVADTSSTNATGTNPAIIIGEIAWAGSSLSTADEWLELWNVGDSPISLAGWRLLGAGGSVAEGISIENPEPLPARGVFLVSNYSNTEAKSVLDVPPNLVTSTLSLLNDKLLIQLLDPEGQLIDQVGDGNAPFAGSNGTPKASMVRVWPLPAENIKENWKTGTSSTNLKKDIQDLGTPDVMDIVENSPSTDLISTVTSSTIEGTSTTTETVVVIPETASSTTATSTLPLEDETASSTVEIVPEPPLEPPALDYGPQQPIASARIEGNLLVGQPIAFDGSSSTDPNGDVLTFLWDFGDGTISQAATSIHTYASSGIFLVSFRTSDGTFFQETTTTLEILPFVETTTTFLAPEAATTTPLETEAVTSTEPVNTTTTAMAPETAASTTLTTAASTASANQKPTPTILLNEVLPYPSSGHEWVELFSPSDWSGIDLSSWTIEDALGPVIRFTASSTLSASSSFLVAHLSSSRFNNDGDVIRLKSADGITVDQTAYASAKKDEAWARDPLSLIWRKTQIATPKEENIMEEPETVEAKTSEPAVSAPILVTEPKTANRAPSPKQTSVLPKTAPSVPSVKPITVSKKETDPATAKTPATKSITKKTTTNAAQNSLPIISITMLSSLPSDTRVRVSGTVGTLVGALTKNDFVILSEDGHGLFIQGNGKQPTPPLDSFIHLTGTLTVNDEGVSLRMLARDRWTIEHGQGKTNPRSVDLLAPTAEDNWSLIQVTGTVMGVRKTLVEIDTTDLPLQVIIKSALNYRAERLTTGDTIQIHGVMDARTDAIKIYPSSANEIKLLAHAKKNQPSPAKTGIPPWTPLGSAGATVALVHGVKFYKKIRERKRLASLLTQAEGALTPPIQNDV